MNSARNSFRCFDCKYGVPGPTSQHPVECLVLNRGLPESSPCQVSIEGLRRQIVEARRADLIAELEDEISRIESLPDPHWDNDAAWDRYWEETGSLWDLRQKLEDLKDSLDYAEVLRYLWGKTTAPNRTCPRCSFTPLDCSTDTCPDHRIPLHFV